MKKLRQFKVCFREQVEVDAMRRRSGPNAEVTSKFEAVVASAPNRNRCLIFLVRGSTPWCSNSTKCPSRGSEKWLYLHVV